MGEDAKVYIESLRVLPSDVRRALDQVLELLAKSFDKVQMPFRLRASTMHYIVHRGKLIRPTLTLLATYSLGADPSRAVLPAASLELIHLASLLQDDIIDGHVIRRGVPTPLSLYGQNHAMLASDLLIAKAVEYAVRTGDQGIIFELINASVRLAIGQGFELELRESPNVDFEDYLNLVIHKTASLIESAMVVGTYSAGRPEMVGVVRDAGRLVGIAFQVRDDLLDYRASGGLGNGELNIVSILNRRMGLEEARREALRILNSSLDRASELLGTLPKGEPLIKYIDLLRLTA